MALLVTPTLTLLTALCFNIIPYLWEEMCKYSYKAADCLGVLRPIGSNIAGRLWRILNPWPPECCCSRSRAVSLLCATIIGRGLLHRVCNDYGPTRAYPVEQRILKEASYKGQTLIWPLPAIFPGRYVAHRGRMLAGALRDEWLYLVGRLLQFHTNWGADTKSKCGHWVTYSGYQGSFDPCRPCWKVCNAAFLSIFFIVSSPWF